jgi:PKD repeat protein
MQYFLIYICNSIMIKNITILLVTLFYSNILLAQNCNSNRYVTELFTSQVTQDVQYAVADPYGISSVQNLKMDIYEPVSDTIANRPLIVYAFGGAYLIGDKRQPDIPLVCNHFAKQGFVVVSIDYRLGFNTLSTGSSIRAVYRGIQDLRAAVRFMCENRTTYRIDTNYIFYSGSSAGCISGLHAAFMTDADRPSYTYGGTVFLEPDDMGCADCSGNTLYGQRVPKPAGIINRWGAILDTTYINDINEDSIPVISFHGTADPAVPFGIGNPFSFPVFPVVMGSSYIHDRLDRLNIYNQLVPLVGAGHEPELIEPRWTDTMFARCTPFLYQILKPNTKSINGINSLCIGDTVIYSVPSTLGSTYCWEVDSNTTIINVSNNFITVVFNSGGSHYIRVQELNSIKCSGDTIIKIINVLSKSDANFTYTNTELTTIFANTSVASTSYVWYFGDGTSSTNISPNHTYSDTGWYIVTLVASNGVCSDTFKQNIYLTKCPSANFSVVTNTLGQLTVFNNSSYTDSVYWSFGDSISSNLYNPNHTYELEGNYTIQLIAFNDSNCSDTFTQNISIVYNGVLDYSTTTSKFFPNPFDKNVYIESDEVIKQIEIKNSIGQEIYYGLANKNIVNIDLEGIENGIYYLKIISKNKIEQIKIIKQ